MRWILLTTLLLTALTAAAQDAGEIPDRSLLWRMETAGGGVLPPEILVDWPRDTVYGYDVDHIDLSLDVDFATTSVFGLCDLFVTVTESELATLPVDLDDDLTVLVVQLDGARASYTRTADQVIVDLPAPPPPDTPVVIGITYSGTPEEMGNKSMRWSQHGGTDIMYTLSTPYSIESETVIPISHYWRPCKDVPDDKSTFACALRVPVAFTACSVGEMTGNVNNGDGTRTFTWQHDYPVAPYLVAVAATNYEIIEESHDSPTGPTAIQHFVYPERYIMALESFNICDAVLTFFDGIYGEYPFVGEKFGHYHTEPGPAVEEQTLVAWPAWLSNGGHNYDWLVVHEIGHMWFGDCITCENWAEVWLNEGFASYSEALWREHLGGFTWLRDYMLGMDNGPYAGTIYDPPHVWDSIVYDKGAWVLHMLRHVMGDEDFFAMLLAYRAAHEYGNVVTDDLIAVCEGIAGEDLNWFFDPWIYEEGRPAYELGWYATGSGPYTVHLTIEQVQSAEFPIYSMPIDVRVVTAGGVEDFVVFNDEEQEWFELVVADAPSSVTLDPDRWILADFTELPTGVPIAPAAAYLAQNSPNPFNPKTTIRFGLSRAGRTALRVFDVRGRMLRTLHAGHLPAGDHALDWDGRDDRGREMPSGVYLYRLVGSDGVNEKRMTLIR